MCDGAFWLMTLSSVAWFLNWWVALKRARHAEHQRNEFAQLVFRQAMRPPDSLN